MALSMAEIRARLTEQENKSKDFSNGSGMPDAFLAHWNIPDGQALNIRFLPDGNPDNGYFWRERDMITLPFNGIVGDSTAKNVRVTVPCNEMWGPTNSCPVLATVREWYKSQDPVLTEIAQKYWKKKSYLLQCFIAPGSCQVIDDVAPENPIRRVVLNKTIFNKVKSILMNQKIEHLPVDYVHGRDFSIIKGKNGMGFAEYDQSTWDFMARELNDIEKAAIDQYGLFNLDDFMPKRPTAEELEAIKEMFEASVDGLPYDPARWAAYYRPAGVQKPTDSSTVGSAPSTASAMVNTLAQQPATKPVAQPSSAASALSALNQLSGNSSNSQPATAPVQTAPAQQTASSADLLARLAASRAKQ